MRRSGRRREVDRARLDLDRPWVEHIPPTFIQQPDAVATGVARGKAGAARRPGRREPEGPAPLSAVVGQGGCPGGSALRM